MNLDFAKYADGLVPAIVQDPTTKAVLMLGFMNKEAIEATVSSGRVTFFSRSKSRLWTKGETSGNYLQLVSLTADCDNDTLLIWANPVGPVCHTGDRTCFGEPHRDDDPISELEKVIEDRKIHSVAGSYVSDLFAAGQNRIAQKVGEEAFEVVIASKDNDIDAFKGEAADLLFHFLILLREKGISLNDIKQVLKQRRK
jgi:phosphoribosyl-ATP pyrophosphohydrolase/phosphoribosyl-AMP cyclohydrolase